MLSDRTLERVSASYRRGYRDGALGCEKVTPQTGLSALGDDTIGGTIRPFANYDYEQGYAAGANDAKWASR